MLEALEARGVTQLTGLQIARTRDSWYSVDIQGTDEQDIGQPCLGGEFNALGIGPEGMQEELREAGDMLGKSLQAGTDPMLRAGLLSNYRQELMHQLDPRVNPAGVEANMTVRYGNLRKRYLEDPEDLNSEEDYRKEITAAKTLEARSPGHLREAAEKTGLLEAFTEWELKSGSTPE